MILRYTASIKLVLAVFLTLSGVEIYQAATRPIHPDEAYVYDRFVRPTVRQVMAQERPNRDVLYALLEKRSVGLFHVSPFSVRLPSLLFFGVYLWSCWQLTLLFLGNDWIRIAGAIAAGLVGVTWGGFTSARGIGAGLALLACAIQFAVSYLKSNQRSRPYYLNLCGVCLGLSVAACLDFAGPAAAIALAVLAALTLRQEWSAWTDRILIPAVVIAFLLLILPLSHTHAGPEAIPALNDSGAAQVQSLLRRLPTTSIRTGASPSAEPIVNFYRAQHRVDAWQRSDRNLASGTFDYYVLESADSASIDRLHLIVIFRDTEFSLARPGP